MINLMKLRIQIEALNVGEASSECIKVMMTPVDARMLKIIVTKRRTSIFLEGGGG